jgi:hypothetical protein
MHRLSTFLLSVLLMGSVAGATTTTYVTTDGVWWAALSPSEKQLALLAEVDGFHAGFREESVDHVVYYGTLLTGFQKAYPKVPFAHFARVYDRSAKVSSEPDFSYHSVARLANKVDDFYAKYPNR